MQHCFLLSRKSLRFLGSAMGIAIANRKNRCDFGALRTGGNKVCVATWMTVRCRNNDRKQKCTGKRLSRAVWLSFNMEGMSLSHLCDNAVAGPAARRDNVLASNCELGEPSGVTEVNFIMQINSLSISFGVEDDVIFFCPKRDKTRAYIYIYIYSPGNFAYSTPEIMWCNWRCNDYTT